MKNYLIVGGSSGIGLQLVQNLSVNNRVFATFCNSQPAEISNVTYSHLNVLDEQLDLTFVPDTIDGIVYCVGAINLKPFARIAEADFIADYRKQVGGAIRIIQNILPKLKLSENPSIVLFSTVAVQLGFPFHSMVASSKGAIEGLTKALAAELAPKIRVNCIAPSITNTPLAANLLNTEEKIAANAQRHPLKKIGEPKDLANMATFLLSDNSAWITGQILHVDGGNVHLKTIMKRPWNLVNVPVYSISSKQNNTTNMNICTYVSAVSMEPKRYMVAIYHNTQTLENVKDGQSFVLQLLSEMQYGLVRNFGQKSGKSFDKQGFINRKNIQNKLPKENPYSTIFWNNFEVLSNAVSILLLKPLQIIKAGDHDMFLCDVVSFENLNDTPILTLDVLRQKKLIRI